MLRFLAVFFLGAAMMAVVALLFVHFVGYGATLSDSGDDWGVFGDYFGGTAGTILAFISVLLLVYTINQQRYEIQVSRDEAFKLDVLQHVSKADEEIERWLRRPISVNRQQVEFGDIVWGLKDTKYADVPQLEAALIRLHKLTCMYCASIALYRDNIEPHFVFQHHRAKAEDLIAFLGRHAGKLGQMAEPALALCREQLGVGRVSGRGSR